MKDYYDILGIPEDASIGDIKGAYRILAHQYHPDKNNGNEKRFKEINEAYRILSDVSIRVEYDQNFKNSRTSNSATSEYQNKPSGAKPVMSRKLHWQIVIGVVCVGTFLYILSGGDSYQPSVSDSNHSSSVVINQPQQNNIPSATVQLPKSTSQQNNSPKSINEPLPTIVGKCSKTIVSKISTRLTDGTTGQSISGTGSAISYANGGYQVSYDAIPGIDNSSIGDGILLCLVSIPTDCPVGDERGKNYTATNLRTGEAWMAQDSQHSCGGA